MKSIYILLSLGVFLFLACNKEDGLFTTTPQSDLLALDGMNDAYETALRYNDSLWICSSVPITCDSSTMFHYDDQFHHFDGMFDYHHNNYSHNNKSDDHHHEGDHGWMMHHEEEHHNEEEHGYEHSSESLELMMNLIEMHEEIHPE